MEGQPQMPPLHTESLTKHSREELHICPLPFSVNMISEFQECLFGDSWGQLFFIFIHNVLAPQEANKTYFHLFSWRLN